MWKNLEDLSIMERENTQLDHEGQSKDIFIELADRCVGRKLDWFEAPDLMRYHEGGFYIKHADSENMDLKTHMWSKVIDRDLSLLIYLK